MRFFDGIFLHKVIPSTEPKVSYLIFTINTLLCLKTTTYVYWKNKHYQISCNMYHIFQTLNIKLMIIN